MRTVKDTVQFRDTRDVLRPETPDFRSLTRCSITSMLAIRRQTTMFDAETTPLQSLVRRSLQLYAPIRVASRQGKNSFRRQIEDCGTSRHRYLLQTADGQDRGTRSEQAVLTKES